MKAINLLQLSLALVCVSSKAQSVSDVFSSIDSSRPLISYEIDGAGFTSLEENGSVRLTACAVDYSHGLKAVVSFENVSADTLSIANVVPFGVSDDSVYITGLGGHPLSRTHLFIPGKDPVNVIVPDNAWELGFSVLDNRYCALSRRTPASVEGGFRRRFETVLYPGGRMSYTIWADSFEGEWQDALKLVFQTRMLYDVEPGSFDDSILEREDLRWIRSCYAANLMMAWDRRFYDISDGKYHVREHLSHMKELIGGYDIYGIWPTWPALGMDQRNQWDMFRDLPGGYDGLREISEVCHSQGTRFMLCYNPWDEDTRSSEGHYDGMTTITASLDPDGFVLDTKGNSSKELQDAADAAKPGIVMYSEGMAVPKDMQGIVSGRVHNALYYCPMLNLCKFIRPDFAILRVAEESHEPIAREFNLSFFNGYGTEINSFSVGRFEWSDDQMRYWGRLLRIQRENTGAFTSFDYRPLVSVSEDHIYVNEWREEDKTVYTIFSLIPEGFDAPLIEVVPDESFHFVDIYDHRELEPQVIGSRTLLPVRTAAFDSRYLGTNNEGSVSAVARFPKLLDVERKGDILFTSAASGTRILLWAGDPSYSKIPLELGIGQNRTALLEAFPGFEGKFIVQLFDGGRLVDERIEYVAPSTARLVSSEKSAAAFPKCPEGMVVIPSGMFRCDEYLTGDSFIPYPDPLTSPGEEVRMDRFYMDRYPVTNAQFKRFLDESGYWPEDDTNFLKHWIDGDIPSGEDSYPVVYVTLEDAEAYAAWAGKRLPTEMEWQYAAQTEAGNRWPWKQKKPIRRVEEPITGTLSVWRFEGIEKGVTNLGDGKPYPVGKYARGRNPYGLYDLTGCVWQLTSDVYDNTTYRYVMVRGGSYFMPSSSFWYIQGGPRELNYRQMLLRVSPSFERNSTVGFRCVADVLE